MHGFDAILLFTVWSAQSKYCWPYIFYLNMKATNNGNPKSVFLPNQWHLVYASQEPAVDTVSHCNTKLKCVVGTTYQMR